MRAEALNTDTDSSRGDPVRPPSLPLYQSLLTLLSLRSRPSVLTLTLSAELNSTPVRPRIDPTTTGATRVLYRQDPLERLNRLSSD